MTDIGRRAFVKGATAGSLALSASGAGVLFKPREARARGAPFRLLDSHQGETIEALGETLAPGAREAGVAHFVDQQISVPPQESLLQARIFNMRPPFKRFYDAAIIAVDGGSNAVFQKSFALLSPSEQFEFVDRMRQNKVENWKGPPGPVVYAVFRSDAVDVVYGTMEGYEALGVPYMPHIAPDMRW